MHDCPNCNGDGGYWVDVETYGFGVESQWRECTVCHYFPLSIEYLERIA